MAALAEYGSLMGELIQADTIALGLVQVGRHDESAVALAVCDLVHRELSWPPRGNLAEALDATRGRLTDEQLALGRRLASDLGVTAGLSWIRDAACR